MGADAWGRTSGDDRGPQRCRPDAGRGEDQIEQAGFTWELNPDKVASDTVPEGKVAQTNPSPGSKVKAGQTIRAYLSSGSDQVDVPDLSGMSQDQARSALKAVGLELGNVTSVDSEKDKDRIVDQDPATGTKVKKGTTVACPCRMVRPPRWRSPPSSASAVMTPRRSSRLSA